MIDYSYQKKAAKKVLANAISGKYLASVLAACPSAGKTTISHLILNQYVLKNPNSRIVVLTEGQNTLKLQYLDELNNPNVDIKFSFGVFGSNAQVQIGLPQSIKKLTWEKIDLLIVDEAHNWYLANTVQNIVNILKPDHKILMTGSPTKYNAYNQSSKKIKFGMHYISANELKKQGVFSAADLDIIRVKDKKDPVNTIRSIFQYSKKNRINMDKIMIACPSIRYAMSVFEYSTKIGRNCSISTSMDINSDKEIVKFKNGYTDTLIVVNKGILGFNDKNITSLFDLKSSNNIDSSYQLFARVLRVHPDKIKKNYIRIADKDYNNQVEMLHKMMALMDMDYFRRFNGSNLKIEYSI